MYLTIYDLSGIQSFIFETNVLREIAGASKITHDSLFGNISDLVAKEDIIYVGGGNALVKLSNKSKSIEITRKLQQRIFEQSGGALRICSAVIEADENKSLAENQRDLMKMLDDNKRTTSPIKTAKGFSINAHDNVTFEPMLLFGSKYSAKSGHLKRKTYTEHYDKLHEVKYVDNFEDFRSDIDGAKNYLAVIHIDGNTMGIRIRDFTEGLAEKGLSFEEQLKELGRLSSEINTTFEVVLNETINKIFTGKDKNDKGKLPFRKVVYDGDDVTVICLATDAFKFAGTFIEKLSAHSLESLGNDAITAGVGIAIIKFGFPFYTAYNVAEELCGNAKKKAIALGYTGENSRSSVDFHVCYGGITTDMKEFRKQNYLIDDYNLALRPYVFDEEAAPFNYSSFEKALENFKYKDEKEIEKTIARSKLKGLRNVYGKNANAVNQYGEMLIARHTGSDKKVAEYLADSFIYDDKLSGTDENGETLKDKYAKHFDVLDVLDFISPAEEDEE